MIMYDTKHNAINYFLIDQAAMFSFIQLKTSFFYYRYSWFMARVVRVFDDGFLQPAATLLRNDSSTLTMIGHYYNNFNGNGHSQIVG